MNPALGSYPPAPPGPVVDTYHGHHVPDPYRWLEDVDSAQTGDWIAAQNALTEHFIGGVGSRNSIYERLERVWDYERSSAPSHEGSVYAYFKNSGLQNQSVLYVAPTLGAGERVLIDPNTFSADGTVALNGVAFSRDGARVAYAITSSGSDWLEWHVRDVATGDDLDDCVAWSKFSGAAWRPDGGGFYYSRYNEPGSGEFKAANYYHKLYFHRLGTLQAEDLLVYERPDHKNWSFAPVVSEDGHWLVVYVTEGTEPHNGIFVQDLTVDGAPMIELEPLGDAKFDYVGNDGDCFYFQTTLAAPLGRVVAVDLHSRSLRQMFAETQDALAGVTLFGKRFIAHYLQDAHSRVLVYDLDGRPPVQMRLPGLGTVGGFEGKRTDGVTFFSFTSYNSPATVYRYDLESTQVTRYFAPRLNFDPKDYTCDQVFYTSKDGTRIPIFLSYRKDFTPNADAPTILYGYGGFNISLTPAFSPAVLVWLEMGGVYAVANLRGGGEYGEAWHRAGTKERKQNVFDDFIAAADFLIAERYTCRAKLAIMGGSNGGLLVGAVMAQRPELFAAALPAVGVMDMLRFQHFTIGWAWASDYGSSDDPQGFEWLRRYSPLHNLQPGVEYPATLITTADHDDRVFPGHSFKFAARLQEVQTGDAPVLIRIESKAGHGAGKPTAKVIAEVADRYAFLVRVLGLSETNQP